MAEWDDMLGRVLGDPQQMEKITALAQSLMGGAPGAASEPPQAASASPSALPEPLRALLEQPAESGTDKRALLTAMQPWLDERHRRKMDRAMQLARMTRIAKLALREYGGE